MNRKLDDTNKNALAIIKHTLNEFDPNCFVINDAEDIEFDRLAQNILNNVNLNNLSQELLMKDIDHFYGSENLKNMGEPFKKEFYIDLEKMFEKLKSKLNLSS